MQKGHRQIIQTIIEKKYLTEMDLLRLQKALLMCRMGADSTFLVDKQAPGYSSKLDELSQLLDQLMAEEERKIVLFSEWTTMLNLIEPSPGGSRAELCASGRLRAPEKTPGADSPVSK